MRTGDEDAPIDRFEFVTRLASALPQEQTTFDQCIEAMLEITRSTGVKEAPELAVEKYTGEMLQAYLQQLFQVADENGDGVLQPDEMARLLSQSGFGFSEELIETVIGLADTNNDGVIEYQEFVPAMIGVLQGVEEADALSAESCPIEPLHELAPEVVEEYFTQLFQIGDVNGDGVLQPEELQRLLECSGYNFPPEVVSEIMEIADTNHDGVIEFREFIPAMVSIVRAEADPWLEALHESSPEEVEEYFSQLFEIGDVNGDGVLQPEEFKTLLELSGYNFPPELVEDLIEAADTNHDGVIEYSEFVPAMVGIVKAQAATEAMPSVGDVPPDMLESYLSEMFKIADTDGNGVLDPQEFESMLEMSGFDFDEIVVKQLMEAADVNKDGVIEYSEFLPIGMQLLGASSSQTW